MFDLELTDEQKLVQETVSSFARSEIRPIARDAAVVRSLTTLTGDTRQPGATIYGNKILVMTRRNGKWGILYGQNTRLTDAEAANLRSAP